MNYFLSRTGVTLVPTRPKNMAISLLGAKLSQRIGLSQRIIYIIQGKLFKILDMVNFMNALILAGI